MYRRPLLCHAATPPPIAMQLEVAAGFTAAGELQLSYPEAEVAHVDERAVRGLDRVARLQHRGAVVAQDLPVRAAGEDAAAEPRPAHLAAHDVDDAPLAGRRAPERARRSHRDACVERELELRLGRFEGHGAPLRATSGKRA